MNKDHYVLRAQLVKKWLKVRRGRLSVLSMTLDIDKSLLYRMINENRLSPELLKTIDSKLELIEDLEKECIAKFEYFRRYIRKGEGRASRLAQALNVSTSAIRDLSYAKGDGRYVLMRYNTQKVMTAIKEIDQRRTKACYSFEKFNVRAFVEKYAPKSFQDLNGIMLFAESVKKYADYGNEDGAVICSIHGAGRYKVVSVGVDILHDDLAHSHICDTTNPHLHGLIFASLGVSKKSRSDVGGLMAFAPNAPCPNCAKRLISSGITEVYCYFEPEQMEGIQLLGQHGIPVFKYQLVNKSLKLINELKKVA